MDDAKAIYHLIDTEREHLERSLPFVASTNSLAYTQSFVDVIVGRADEVFELCDCNTLTGIVGFKVTNCDNHKIEFGYWLFRHYEGQGIITRALEHLYRYAFD